MSGSTTMVSTARTASSARRGDGDEIVSYAADILPIAWVAMFAAEDVQVVPGGGWLTLFSTKSAARARLIEAEPVLREVFPPSVAHHLPLLLASVDGTPGDHLQVFLHDAVYPWTETERDTLVGLLRAVRGWSVEAWRGALSFIDCELGESLGALRFHPGTIVNGLVGWVTGQPCPDDALGPSETSGSGEPEWPEWEEVGPLVSVDFPSHWTEAAFSEEQHDAAARVVNEAGAQLAARLPSMPYQTRLAIFVYFAIGGQTPPEYDEPDPDLRARIRIAMLRDGQRSERLLSAVLGDPDPRPRVVLAQVYGWLPGEDGDGWTWRVLATDPCAQVRAAVAASSRAPVRPGPSERHPLVRAASAFVGVREQAALAAHPVSEVRRYVGGNSVVAREVLERLASDPAASVRAAVAGNPHTPVGSLERLVHDDEREVRLALVREARLHEANWAPDEERDAYRKVVGRLTADPDRQVAREAKRLGWC